MLETLAQQINFGTVVIFGVVFSLAYYWMSRPKNLPPGPAAWPLMGNLPSFLKALRNGSIINQLAEWRQKYGGVFTIKMGRQNLIVISDYKIAKELFVKNGDVSSGRPHTMYILSKVAELTGSGVVFTDGPIWKELRRVTLMTMRDFGVGKKTLEQRVQDEARAIVDVLEQGQVQGQGYSFRAKPLFAKFAANVICSVIFGNRFEYTDATFNELTRLIHMTLNQPLLFSPANFFTLARFIPFVKKMHNDVFDSFKRVDEFLEQVLREHENTYDENEIRDFIDVYIKTRSESQDAHLYNARNMRRVIIDLFFAGTETSATTGEWFVLLMAAHPDVQKRCQQELDKVVGQERLVTMDDKKSLPYLEAVINETLRYVTIVPVAPPHRMVRDVKIAGYDVPAEALVMINMMEIHHDLGLWSDPMTFKPERFLDKDGQFCMPKQGLSPFSMGPRACLGEVLARMEFFVLFCTLVQFFTFTPSQGQEFDLVGTMGITHSAKHQNVIATRR